jgi:hypothetical protein
MKRPLGGSFSPQYPESPNPEHQNRLVTADGTENRMPRGDPRSTSTGWTQNFWSSRVRRYMYGPYRYSLLSVHIPGMDRVGPAEGSELSVQLTSGWRTPVSACSVEYLLVPDEGDCISYTGRCVVVYLDLTRLYLYRIIHPCIHVFGGTEFKGIVVPERCCGFVLSGTRRFLCSSVDRASVIVTNPSAST